VVCTAAADIVQISADALTRVEAVA